MVARSLRLALLYVLLSLLWSLRLRLLVSMVLAWSRLRVLDDRLFLLDLLLWLFLFRL